MEVSSGRSASVQNGQVRYVTGLGECGPDRKNDNGYQRALHPLKAGLLTESVLMKSLSQWVRHNGIISYDTLRTREELDSDQAPCVANFDFDVTAASYLNPLLQFSRSGKFGPVSLSAICFWAVSSVLCTSSPLLQNVVQ